MVDRRAAWTGVAGWRLAWHLRSWYDAVMLDGGLAQGQPAVAGCCVSRRRLIGKAGADAIWELSDRRMVGEVSSAGGYGSR